MQLIDPHKPFFVDTLPAPNTVATPQDMAFTTFQNTKQYFTLFFPSTLLPPFLLFNVEAYNANPTYYDNYIAVNSRNVGNYSYILNQITNNAYRIWWIKITWRFGLATDAQLNQPLSYIYKDANGLTKTDQILDMRT